MVTVELHRFEAEDPNDYDPQELVCACGAKIARTGTEEQLTNTGWYFIEGPASCPTREVEKLPPPPEVPGG
jgi:hypothetical protein